jgi:heme oxygenase (biliverdin-IX-beta and delta-forming)
MPSTAHQAPTDDLRIHLRAATMAAHGLLDRTMQAASGWRTLADYARFLALQYAARVPVEHWLACHAPRELRPPVQTPLIAQDLTALGIELPAPASPLRLAGRAESEAIGTAWVLAGSALGNRSILMQMRRASAAASPDGEPWPSAFLGNEAMLAFWQGLRSLIEQPASAIDADAAAEAASTVFEHFTAHAKQAVAGSEA